MKEELRQLFETQVTKELESAYIYLHISNFYAIKGLDGFANWFKKQAAEEVEHAQKFIDYMIDSEVEFKLNDIKATPISFKNLKEPLELQLKHEKYVTSLINALFDEAVKQKDHTAVGLLTWFIAEQQEEEKQSKELLDKFAIVGEEGLGLYQLNKDLGKR